MLSFPFKEEFNHFPHFFLDFGLLLLMGKTYNRNCIAESLRNSCYMLGPGAGLDRGGKQKTDMS